jgi:flagellar motor protein MotB
LTNYFLVAAISFSFAACSLFTSYKEEAGICDALIARHDSIQKAYDSIDFEEIEIIGKTVEAEMDSIKKLLSTTGFALKKEDAMFLGRYKSVSKPYRKLEETRQTIEFDLRLSKKQLADLKQDIDNKKIEKEALSTHLETEEEALQIVIKNINNFLKSKASVQEEFEKDKVEIKRIFKDIEGK